MDIKVRSAKIREFVTKAVQHDGGDCLAWPFAKRTDGRGTVYFDGKKMKAHRLVCLLKHGPPPFEDAKAIHSCGCGHEACVSGGHVRWGTSKDNMADRTAHGTCPIGEGHRNAKLTAVDVREIRADDRPQTVIAADYGVTQAAVSAIRVRKVWAHI